MTSSGPEPPTHEIGTRDEPTPFYSGNTAVLFDPPATDDYGGDHVDGGDDELDSEFAPQPRRRLGKLTIVLAALLVAGAGFLGGLQVQKHAGTTTSAASTLRRGTGTGEGGTGGFGGGTGGFGGGGFTGRGTGTGTGNGGTGAGGTGGGTGTGGSGTGIPAVIGSIVSVTGDTVVVKNLGGKLITVKLSGTTTITQTGTVADLKPGENVTVGGTTGADGTVSATTVGTR